MKKKGGDLICMRPDSIVEARFKLTKKQNDIMDMVFSNIEDDEKLEYEINISKYAKLYNIRDKSDVYGELKKAVKTFEGKGFAITEKISEKKESRIYFSWFSSIQYMDGEGKIIFELGKKLKQLFLDMKRATFYNIQYTINFNCIYSKRLYYYLKMYEDTGKRIDNLDLLRNKLECPTSYNKYANFRRFVLEPAYEEINGNSDINFEYEEIKTKNAVTGIKFSIKSNKPKVANAPKEKKQLDEVVADREPTPLDNFEEIVHQTMAIMKHDKVGFNEAHNICDESNGDLELISKAYEYVKTKKEAGNVVGYTIDTIKRIKSKTFNEPKKSSGSNSFNNFEAREYDYDALEKKLLGWE